MSGEIDFYKEWLGIPEGDRPPDHYQLLRLVEFEDDEEKIRAHYKKLNNHIRKYATGQYSAQSQDMLNEMAKAMLCLTDPERKREYDRDRGREFDDEDDDARVTVLQYLTGHNVIARDQVVEVEDFAEARGLSTRDAVIQMKLATPNVATQALAQQLGLPYVDLEDMIPDDDVLDEMPRNVVRRHSVLPLFVDDNVLMVACSNEPTEELEDEIRLRFGRPMRAALADPAAVKQCIAKYYAPGVRNEAASSDKSKKKSKASTTKSAAKSGGGRRKRMSELSADEQKERKQVGTIILLWSFIGSALLFWYGLFPYTGLAAAALISLALLGAGVFFVTKVYWK